MLDNKSPITVDELLTKLENQVAKSTLYRVLSDLKKINILQEITNLENQSVVELLLDTDSHHHHLFCSDCGEIIDVEMANEFEEKLSKNIQGHFNTYKQKFSLNSVTTIPWSDGYGISLPLIIIGSLKNAM